MEDNKPKSQNPTPNLKTFEDFDLHFDDPTDGIIADKVQDGDDELFVEGSKRSRWN